MNRWFRYGFAYSTTGVFLFNYRPVLAVVFHWYAFEFEEAGGGYELEALFLEDWDCAVYGFEGVFVAFEYVKKVHYAVGLILQHELKAFVGGAFRNPVFAAVAADEWGMNYLVHEVVYADKWRAEEDRLFACDFDDCVVALVVFFKHLFAGKLCHIRVCPGMIFDVAAKLYSAFNNGCILFCDFIRNQKE